MTLLHTHKTYENQNPSGSYQIFKEHAEFLSYTLFLGYRKKEQKLPSSFDKSSIILMMIPETFRFTSFMNIVVKFLNTIAAKSSSVFKKIHHDDKTGLFSGLREGFSIRKLTTKDVLAVLLQGRLLTVSLSSQGARMCRMVNLRPCD